MSNLPAIRDMQMKKTTLRLHLVLIRKTPITTVLLPRECEPEGTLYTLLVGMSVSLATWRFLQKSTSTHRCPSDSIHGYSPKRLSQRHRTPVFTVALYTTRKLWNQPGVRGTDGEYVVYMHDKFLSSLNKE